MPLRTASSCETLHRLESLAVLLAGDDRRFRDLQLVAFTAHGLDEDRQLKLAAAGDAQHIRLAGFFHAQADVAPTFGEETLVDLSRRHVLAFAPAPRRGVDAEDHRDRRLLDADRRQRNGPLAVRDRVADREVLDAANRDDVAGARACDL